MPNPEIPAARRPASRRASARGALLAVLTMLLAGCGGSGTMSSGPSANACTSMTCGTVQIALTDADGDFLRYSVGVVALDLTKADGTVIHVLPASPTMIDFAQLVNFTEILTAADLPQGAYNKGSITLDYTNADVEVEVAGQAVKATVTDPQGNPLTQQTLEIKLDDHEPLVVQANHLKLLTFDFNLAASNQVDITQSPPVVQVSPFLTADVDPAMQKATRVRGPLVSVDVAGMSYVVNVRPFDRDDAEHDGDFGQVVVQTDANTAFEVNGVAGVGSAGLEALNALAVGAPTIALGTVTIDPTTQEHTFLATSVKAGDSVPGHNRDAILGNVVSRNGNTLMVRGATITHDDGHVAFSDNVTVTIGPDTDVRKDDDGDFDEDWQDHKNKNDEGPGHSGATQLDIGAISVGQRIVVQGVVSGVQDVTIDATNGRVRLLATHITGTVNATAPGQLTIALTGIDHRDPAIFDFTGTGMSPAEDATPANYQVNTGTLNFGGALGAPVRISGFVVPFGQAAATVDFDAIHVKDLTGADHALLAAGWGPTGTIVPFTSIASDGITLDLANPTLGTGHSRHFLVTGGAVLDLLTLATPVTLTAPASGEMHFAIKNGGSVQFFSAFADFAAALTGAVDGTNVVSSLYAEGTFDSATGSFPARLILVRVGASDLD